MLVFIWKVGVLVSRYKSIREYCKVLLKEGDILCGCYKGIYKNLGVFECYGIFGFWEVSSFMYIVGVLICGNYSKIWCI